MTLEEINKTEPNGSTALHVAAYRGHQKIVELLLQKGANCLVTNKYGLTPCDEAKTPRIKQLISRRMTTSRFVSDSLEWVVATNDADYQAHEYWEKLGTYGRDPKCVQLIVYIKENYLEKDLRDIRGHEKIKRYFDTAISEKDPIHLLTAYTADTEFFSALNKDLAQLKLKDLTAETNLSRAYFIGIVARHPNFETLSYTGTTFRGMVISNDDLKQYKIGTRILTKTFSSSSKRPPVALSFLNNHIDTGERFNTICIYEIRNKGTGLDIAHLSEFKEEEEVLILPYSAFKIIDIKQNKSNLPKIEIKLKECEPW